MRRTGVQVAGIVAIVAGVVVGAILWLAAGRRYDDAVAELAPVPLGCTTTLSFDRTGTYTFFVETKGEIGEIDGDCVTDDRTYDVDAGEVPRVSLELTDERGDEVDLDRAAGPTYDRAGRRGVGVRVAEIDESGDYELTATATSEDADVVVRVGRDPATGVAALRAGGVAALVLGVVAGIMLLVFGRRRPQPVPAAPARQPWPSGQFPTTPPLAPPAANPPVPPPYTPRPASHGPYQQPRPPEHEPQPERRPPGRWPGDPLPPPRPPR